MRYYQLSVFSALVTATLHNLAMSLTPPWHDVRVKHTWEAIPPNWESLGHPPPGTTINLYIALKPHRERALVDALYDVSDPRSSTYGAHLSKDQVAQLVAPHSDTLDLIYSWLGYHNIPSPSISATHSGSCLKVAGVPVSQANELLGASYRLYRRTGTNDPTILRTIGYSIPKVLHDHVRTVMPTTYFTSRAPRQALRKRFVNATANTTREILTTLPSRDDDDDDIGVIEPADLRWLYRMVYYVPSAVDENLLGVAGFLNHYPSPTDLTSFMIDYRTDALDATFTVEKVNNGQYDPNNPDPEANLDMQYTQVITFPTRHVFYSSGGEPLGVPDTNEPAEGDMWAEWLDYLTSDPEVPQTISLSYGDLEQSLPLEYATTLCEMFAQLGALGVSILCASGDDGVGEGNCKAEDGSVHFVPEWPSSCPYVTSVGGTKRQYPEIAANLSGGGFSNHFSRPPYQDEAVTTFLQQLDNQYDNLFNREGRGIPDVSAQALRYAVIHEGEKYHVSGTSASVPTVAGIISLLNDYLIAIEREPLGWLNPWLYSKGREGLTDILSGYNPGCGTDGFSAVAGWDPVTGLGTPDFLDLQYILHRMGYEDPPPSRNEIGISPAGL